MLHNVTYNIQIKRQTQILEQYIVDRSRISNITNILTKMLQSYCTDEFGLGFYGLNE